jgi:Protein of unknown function (DUF1559)
LRLSLRVQAADAEMARELHELVGRALKRLPDIAELKRVKPLAELLPRLAPRLDGDRLTVELDVKALTPTLEQLAALAAIDQKMNDLKMVALAIFKYYDRHGTLPPSYSVDKAGKPLLSWRVLILPYLEQQAVYRQFHLDEPWDSPHNIKLLPLMPKVFRSTNAKLAADHRTTVLAPVGAEPVGRFSDRIGEQAPSASVGTSSGSHIGSATDPMEHTPEFPTLALGLTSPPAPAALPGASSRLRAGHRVCGRRRSPAPASGRR